MRASALRRSESGATAVEYGLIAGLLALGILGSLVTTKTSLNAVFGIVSSGVGSAGSSAAAAPAGPASTAGGQPGVAKLDFASKGNYIAKQVFTGCNLGNCNQVNETEYRYAGGSYIDIRPQGNGYNGIYAFQDNTGTVANNYYFNTNSGNGDPGDTLYISGVINGQNYQDTMTFQSNGTVTGTRSTYVNNQQVTSTVATMQRSDFQYVFNAAAFARTLN